MIELSKVRLGALIGIFVAIAFASCNRQPDTGTKVPPSNANTNDTRISPSTNSSGPGARLDRFVGSWGGYAGKTTAVSGQVGLDSRWMKVTVKQVSPGSIALDGDIWQAKATLKYDATSDKYLLTFAAEDFPQVTEMPMTFSEADGFSGTSMFTNKGKEFKAKATIKDDKGESEWKMNVTQAKDMWNMTIRLGKAQ